MHINQLVWNTLEVREEKYRYWDIMVIDKTNYVRQLCASVYSLYSDQNFSCSRTEDDICGPNFLDKHESPF